MIAGRCRLVGFDVTEVNPVYDFSGATARIAARLLLDTLSEALPETRGGGTSERR